MDKNSFMMVGEKTIKNQVEKMCWSPKKDLLCLSLIDGDVLLYRLLGLTRVWVFSSPEKSAKVNDISWRPDGSVIAVSYNSKEIGIKFIFMEKCKLVWDLNSEKNLLKHPMTIIKWTEICTERKLPIINSSLTDKEYICEVAKLKNDETNFLASSENIIGSCSLHVLVCVDTEMNSTLFVYGIFPIIYIPNSMFQPSVKVIDVCLSDDFQTLSFVSAYQNQKKFQVDLFDTGKLLGNIDMCSQTGKRACILTNNLDYIGKVLDEMKESCETAVQEMELKLIKNLLDKNTNETIGDGFLDLLLWGNTSDMLVGLLTNNFKEKEIINLGMLVKSSYNSIQQLLLVNFQLACENIYYQLNEIKAMRDAPNILDGVKLFANVDVNKIMHSVGTLLLKSNEMQQVISESLQSFKAFLNWLYVSLNQLNGEKHNETEDMLPSDLKNVADFITESFNYNQSKQQHSKHFNLDKVYQYLQDYELTMLPKQNTNNFATFVDTSSLLSNNHLIIKPDFKKSLKQMFNNVEGDITKLLYSSYISLTKGINKSNLINCNQNISTYCHWCSNSNGPVSFGTILPTSSFPTNEMVYVNTKINQQDYYHFYFQAEDDEKLRIIDAEIYNDRFITFLFMDKETNYFLSQVALKFEKFIALKGKPLNCYQSIQLSRRLKNEPGFEVMKVATSGFRNIACLLNSSRRHITAFEMDQNENSSDIEDITDNETSVCDGP